MIRILYENEDGLCCASAEFLQYVPQNGVEDLPDHVWFYCDGYLVEIEVDKHLLDGIFVSALKLGYVDLSVCTLLSEVPIYDS